MNAVENNNIALQVRYEQEQELRDTILLFDGDEKKLTLIIDAKNKAQIVGAVDGVVGSIEGLVSLVTDIPGNVVALADAVINYKQTYDAIKISVTEWTELYDYALKNNPALAGEMAGYLEGKIGGGIVTGYAVSGAAAKVIVKVARLKKASKLVNKGTNRSRKKTDIKKEFDRNHGKSFETLKEEFNTGKGTNAGKGTSNATGQAANNLNINELVNSANKPVNAQGLSKAARAWEKHAGRQGGTFDLFKGNVTQRNVVASEFVKGVLENPYTIRTELSLVALNIDYLTAKESAITLMVLFLVF